ncbi:MAG: hypothetical protein Q8L60_10295 [Gammaproteobacteria bacterium]|nr:hypothetical protein [Gammaproteobacteria bacterium]MDP2346389.1 hypothetical protein [Gammaproteobacteria bacterium]
MDPHPSDINAVSVPLRRPLQVALNVLALFFLFSAFVIPNRLSWIGWWSWTYFPLEIVVVGLLLLVPGRNGLILRCLAAALLAAGIVFRIADMSAFMVFARPFNPVLDTYLLSAGMNLLNSSIGRIGALLVALLLVLLVVLIVVLSWLALGRVQRMLQKAPRAYGVALLAGLVVWMGLSFSGWPGASRYFYDQLAMHVRHTMTSFAELREFREVVNVDAYADVPGDALFGTLRGKDVLVVFVESYGRIVLDSDDYAPHIKPVLEQATATLAAQGYQSRSGFLTSPTVGGISWLAHGTALSGLWIDSQIRYDSLMISERPSLVRLFNRAGWRTIGVMPAITLAWPEGQYYGYDKIYAAVELNYQGLPFNYVTMPDQFTMARFQQEERTHDPRTSSPRTTVMAEIALISSHAPWVPIPEVIDWNAVGDGSVFYAQASSGEAPEVMWQDKDKVLKGYRDSIAYVLNMLVSYVTTFGDDNLVVMIIGDHQPMPYVTDESENKDVLVHMIARDPGVMEAITHWQWSDGMLPEDDAPVWRMDAVRDNFIEAFSFSQ